MTVALEWSGRTGDAWADEWQRTDRSFTGLSRQLDAAILAAAPERGTALDIGCGAGGTSIALATARPHLAITGVDLSAALVKTARERAAMLPNLHFETGDAQALGRREADLLFSRHGVMFFADPVAGFAALRGAARAGAKLVFSCFRARACNRWAFDTEAAVGAAAAPGEGYAPGPFGLADADFTRDMLARAGWIEATAQIADFDYIAGAGDDSVADALSYFSRIGPAARSLAAADPDRREPLRAALRAMLAANAANGAVTFAASAWIWTATAGEPA